MTPALTTRMLRALLPLGLLALAGCAPSPPIPSGTWTGALTPERHPEMASPVAYRVAYPDGALTIEVVGADASALPARDAQLDGDTLRFAFDEPEGDVPLTCALGRDADGFAGRCTAPDGQWAHFTMRPPTGG